MICESNLDTKNQSKILNKISNLLRGGKLEAFNHESILLKNRAGILNYENKNYFKAGDYLYKSLSILIISNTNCISKVDLLKSADRLIFSAGVVKKENEKDYRINLWKSVAYHIKNDKLTSAKYFKEHLKVSPKYFEKEFTKYFFYNIFSKV